jgi:hypothetical protein
MVSVCLSDVTSPDVTDSREKRNQGQSIAAKDLEDQKKII